MHLVSGFEDDRREEDEEEDVGIELEEVQFFGRYHGDDKPEERTNL